MTAGGEPTRKLCRHVATRPKEEGRIGIIESAGQEVETRHFQTSPNVVRVPDDRVRFEAPKQKVCNYNWLDDDLRHVVAPVVQTD